ncbi:hypothetical protein Tco_0781221 [Tanacetum coccineum]
MQTKTELTLEQTQQGVSDEVLGAASGWAAHKVRGEHESKFDATRAAKEGQPVLLTGEMVFPWMFDEIHALKPFKEAAILLAEKEDWPPLYKKTALSNNKYRLLLRPCFGSSDANVEW